MKCKSCLERKKMEPDNGVLVNMELGVESVEKLVEDQAISRKGPRMKTLRNSIWLLSIVESLNSKNLRNGLTCGTPNSHISACASYTWQLFTGLRKTIEFLLGTYFRFSAIRHFLLEHTCFLISGSISFFLIFSISTYGTLTKLKLSRTWTMLRKRR